MNRQRSLIRSRILALGCTVCLSASMVTGCGAISDFLISHDSSADADGDGGSAGGGARGQDRGVSAASDKTPVVFIFDASSSMIADDADGTRLAAAKFASNKLLNSVGMRTPLSLITFGDTVPQSVGDSSAEGLRTACRDVTVHFPLSVGKSNEATGIISRTEARGYTPIALALEKAQQQLSDPAAEATIVLLSDGEDTCEQGDPVEAARRLRRDFPRVTINTVGLKTSNQQLTDIAEAGGGTFITADNITQLTGRLQAARSARSARSQLSDSGLFGVSVGMPIRSIIELHGDFPRLSSGKKRGRFVVIRWRDCVWRFTKEGTLVSIAVDGQRSTIDGLSQGSGVDEARQLFGDPLAVEREGSAWVAFFRASGELTWKVTYTSDDDGATGTITMIEVCSCRPSSGSSNRSSAGSSNRSSSGSSVREAKPGSGMDDQGRFIVTFDSYGPVSLGDPSSKMQQFDHRASGTRSDARDSSLSDSERRGSCFVWALHILDGWLLDAFEYNGRIGKIGVSETEKGIGKTVITDRGIVVGSTGAEVKKAYPNLKVYDRSDDNPTIPYLAIAEGPGGNSIYFTFMDTDNDYDRKQPFDESTVYLMYISSENDPDNPSGYC